MSTSDDPLGEALERGLPVTPAADLAALRAAAQAELKARPRARSWWVDALLLLGVNLALGLGTSAALGWNTVQHASAAFRLVTAAALLVILGVGSVAAIMPRGRGWRLALVGLVLVAAGLTALGASGFDGGVTFGGGVGCAMTECALSVVPVGVALGLLTRFGFDPLRALTAGTAAGAGGLLALHLHCPIGTVEHLLAFHLAPWLGLAALAVVLRRVLPTTSHAP